MTVTIRPATDADHPALSELAALDSATTPSGETLLAFVDGELRAALSLDRGVPLADPFRLTDDAVEMLRLRAVQQAKEAA